MTARDRLLVLARAAGAGLCIAASVPPWGWWPLAFAGIALLDQLIAGRPAASRFRRTWLVAACWLYPSTVWMLDLTAPGWVVAQAVYATFFGVAAVAVPPGRGRRLALPGAVVLAEWARWSWPFGGVPLSTLPMGQAAGPLAPSVRTLGPLLLAALVVAIGVGLSAALERGWRTVVAVAAVVAVAMGWAAIAPEGRAVGTIDVALVQGGGPQRTRAAPEQNPLVLQRHVDASALVTTPVDLVLWPENVVNPRPPYLRGPVPERFLSFEEATETVRDVARRLEATLLPGWFYAVDDDSTVNYTEVVSANGEAIDRYDKVRAVPFGEFVPLRSLIEPFAGGALPPRDLEPGDGPAVVDTPVGRAGVAISWEVFFDTRARDSVRNGGQILLNPTNGSSYWLTIVQSQQIASSKLRALETGRWVLQAAPTGFSAIVTPDGEVIARTGISEQAVLQGTVELRDGTTLAVRFGRAPMVAIAVLLVAAGWAHARLAPTGGWSLAALRHPRADAEHAPHPSRNHRGDPGHSRILTKIAKRGTENEGERG